MRVAVFFKDGEALRKFSRFDNRFIVLCRRKPETLLTYLSPVLVRSNTWKTTFSLPTPMMVPYLYSNVAQHALNGDKRGHRHFDDFFVRGRSVHLPTTLWARTAMQVAI